MLNGIWKSYVAPMLGRPARVQIAALCHRDGDTGPEVLLITSRSSKRWILPKGWPMPGTDGAGTALQEAWEEAGVKHCGVRPWRIGRYRYNKILDGGLPSVTDVDVYAIRVSTLLDSYPEMDERVRNWMRPEAAAEVVAEEELKTLLLDLPRLLGPAPQH